MKKTILFGENTSKSFSPCMHNAGFKALGLDIVYETKDVPKGKVEDIIETIRLEEVLGANITIPHKEDICSHLDELTKTAQISGSVNLVFKRNNKLIGDNTDGIGFVECLKARNILFGKYILIGAGGAGRGVASALLSKGFCCLAVFNRTIDRAVGLVSDLCKINSDEGRPFFTPSAYSIKNLNDDEILSKIFDNIKKDDNLVVVNTLPAGSLDESIYDKFICYLSKKSINSSGLYGVCEMAYISKNHSSKTIKHNGFFSVNGLELLYRQALPAFRIWTGCNADHEMLEALVDTSKVSMHDIFEGVI